MPKIGKENITIGNHHFEFETYYNKSDGFYFKGLDDRMISIVRDFDGNNAYPYHFATEAALISSTRAALKRYYEITASDKRVIIIKLKFGTAIAMNKVGIGDYMGANPRTGDAWKFPHGDLDYGVSFQYLVGVVYETHVRKFFEILTDDEGNEIKRTMYAKDMTQFNKDNQIEMDWTLERERYLKSLISAMEEMAAKMSTFFSNKDGLLLSMEGGKLFLNQ